MTKIRLKIGFGVGGRRNESLRSPGSPPTKGFRIRMIDFCQRETPSRPRVRRVTCNNNDG